MKKEAEPLDIRPEYDFSEGVRGKYAKRFLGSKRSELLRTAAMLDSQAWLAHSLLSFQTLESYLVAYQALVLDHDPDSAGRAVTSLMEFEDENVLATLRRDLDDHTGVREPFYRELLELIADRNWLVHHSLWSHSPSRLQSIAERSNRLSEQLLTLLLERCRKEGMNDPDIRTRIDETVERWATGRNAV